MILHEGINEAGSVASFTAVGTSYATHGEPMIPIYIFYSMFGFQRTGDGFWAAADQMTRGFVLGATAGRTTLNGEGLQHEDGHSLLLASTNPAVVAYDPAFGFEVGHIVRDGLRRMYGEDAGGRLLLPDGLQRAVSRSRPSRRASTSTALLRGMYLLRAGGRRARGRAAGADPRLRRRACRGRCGRSELLRDDWGVHADVWSVTSWNELRRDGLDGRPSTTCCTRTTSRARAFVTQQLDGRPGPGRRGVGLHARGAGPDRAVGAGRLRVAGHRRVRAVRHPRCAAPALQGRRRVDRRADAGAARTPRRGRRGRAAQGDREVRPARRPAADPGRGLGES